MPLLPLPSGRWLGRVLLAAALLVGGAWLVAPLLTEALAAAAPWDDRIGAALHAWAAPAVLQAMSLVSEVHGTAGILAMSALLAAVLGWRGSREALWPLVATVPGGLLLNAAVKLAVQRPRPAWGYAAQLLPTYSFPSGHTAGATVLYGMIVCLAWPHLAPHPASRAAVVVLAALAVLLVATSRVMLGQHYPTDCVGGMLEGGAWLAACNACAGRQHVNHAVIAPEARR